MTKLKLQDFGPDSTLFDSRSEPYIKYIQKFEYHSFKYPQLFKYGKNVNNNYVVGKKIIEYIYLHF